MDFIERILHIAPDGGTGMLELSILALLSLVPLAVLAFGIKHLRRGVPKRCSAD